MKKIILIKLIERFLTDAVLGFFALLSLFLFIAPLVFEFNDSTNLILAGLEYAIILLFILEYTSGLLLAKYKMEFVIDGRRVIDILIILSALIAFIPLVPDVLRHSPVFRLIRVGRIALLGARSSLALKIDDKTANNSPNHPETELKVQLLGNTGTQFEVISWEQGLNRISNGQPDWLFISGLDQSRLISITEALRVPVSAVKGLFSSSSAGFDTLENFSTFFVRYPRPMLPGERLIRTPILLVGTAVNVVVMSREHTDLDEKVQLRLSSIDTNTPKIVRATLALVSEIMSAYTQVTETIEVMLTNLELEQSLLADDAFLARTFTLRADILKTRASMKHLKSVIRDLHSGKINIANASPSAREPFRFLADDALDLYDNIEDIRESLQGLVDLRLNVASFQMNRVMRLLALLTALALIPATIGGLLGMNITDAPWPATLSQIAFGVGVTMTLSLYIFAIKGWLR
ncbi:CorA family divalent cation transporter [Paraglaciecola sp. L3A3]|uniref:CorA family divalent cation transporter n=1 Tax=Paraglaciecola sp. L3A3 TaxID=2686358 RepID=UPI00131D969E|nr:CorA family divalent cation transporter [Paraglaciecola sp. L3A3]